MKKFTIIIAFLLLSSVAAIAQSGKGREKIESARIAMITKELNLTPEQAERFWPLYNEFKDKRADIARTFNQERQAFDASNATEDERKKMVARGLELKQQQLNLEKEYSQRLLDVISSRQIIQLREAEDRFRKMLLDRLQQNRERRQDLNRDDLRNRREDWQRKKSNN